MICLTPFGVIFLPVAKVILRLRRSDILFASSTAARQYHSAESRISLRSNRTRRKANRTEKSTCYCKCFFLGGSGWTRALFGVRLLRKPPIYRLVVLIHPFLHKNNQPQKRLVIFGGSGWIRTTEVVDNRFTVCPLWPLGNTPT